MPLLIFCVVAFVLGVLLRENRLTAQVTAARAPDPGRSSRRSRSCWRSRSRRGRARSPRSTGSYAAPTASSSADLGRGARRGPHRHPGLARPSTSWPRRSGLPVVARFAEGIAVAVERGTPLADVLHAQAADVREAGRRALIESGARKEVLMMVPVVFLVLPVTVVFAFWPGLVGLHLVDP